MCSFIDTASDIRNAWEVHFSNGKSVTVYDTNEVKILAESGSVIKVIHAVIVFRPFGNYSVGQHISRACVTGAFI